MRPSVAERGWATVAVGRQLGFLRRSALPPGFSRPVEVPHDRRRCRRLSRDRGSGTAGRHSRCCWYRAHAAGTWRGGYLLEAADGQPGPPKAVSIPGYGLERVRELVESRIVECLRWRPVNGGARRWVNNVVTRPMRGGRGG